MDRKRKLIEQWNEDEAVWRRYVELLLTFRSIAENSFSLDDETNDWAWLEAVRTRGPLDCVGFKDEP